MGLFILKESELAMTPTESYNDDFGCSAAQYHAGVAKLWEALGVAGPQQDDVFTLAAREITRLKRKVKERPWIDRVVEEQLCGCGCPVRYIVPNGDGTAGACNKYARCPSWDELKARCDKLYEAARAFADEPMDRNTYTLDHAKRRRLLDVLSSW